MKKQLLYYIFPIIFLICSSAPFWGLIFYHNTESQEKRVIIKIQDIHKFSDFKTFLLDNHAFRDRFYKICVKLYLNIYKESPFPKRVILGKGGWLFLGDTFSDVYSSSLGITDINNKTIDKTCNNLSNIKTFCDSIDTEFILAIAPNKGTVYSEYLPLKPNSRPRLKNLIKPKLSEIGIKVIDLTDTLLVQKNHQILYYKGDSHWNNFGAFIGLQKLLLDISKTQNVEIPILESYTKAEGLNTKAANDIASIVLLNEFDTYYEIKSSITPNLTDTVLINKHGADLLTHTRNKSNNNDTKAFVLHDSYFYYMNKSFAASIKETSSFRYFNRTEILKEIRRAGKPDFILLITVERNLPNLQERSFD